MGECIHLHEVSRVFRFIEQNGEGQEVYFMCVYVSECMSLRVYMQEPEKVRREFRSQ